jgi:parallel beta-helix repeat protein
MVFILIMTLPFIPGTYGAETKNTTTQSNQTDNQKTEFTIQTLLNNAEPGTTIHLPSGIFQEILTITKPLTIIGNTTDQTVLAPTSAPNGYALHITAEGVTLSNLQITNHATGLYTTGVKISASNCIITNCTFTNTPIGIALWSSQNQISHSLFDNCSDEGIVLLGTPTNPCSNNTITSSIFTNNCDGIELQYAPFNHITTCHFTSNTHAGIDAIESDNNHNTITHCTFTDNAAFGVYLARSTQNLITHCSFTTDTLTLIQSPENTLIKTQIHDIQLLEESSLILDQCNDTTVEKIISEHSSFEFRTPQDHSYEGEKRGTARYHLILISLLSYLKTLKTFADQLTKARM